MAYPFVAAAAKYGLRKGPVKAFIVHMAEGGGTVSFLSKPNDRGVSVHYVVEYSGRIVQMVREIEATGSINPQDIRTTDDADGFYGASVAKAVMGDWWKDPNSAAITCEVEGFAKTGPNAAQHGSLKVLAAEVRTRYPGIGLLGHRDFQDYKACPGKLVHWEDIGGHGQQQETDVTITVTVLPFGGRYTIEAGTAPVGIQIDANGNVTGRKTWTATTRTSSASYDATVHVPSIGGNPFLRCTDGFFAGYLLSVGQVTEKPNDAPATDCTNAVAAQREKDRVASLAALEGVFA